VLQNNVTLFGQLNIVWRTRMVTWQSSLHTRYSPSQFPLSLSDFGKIHLTSTKSELLWCLEQTGQPDCTVLDYAIIVHCLSMPATLFFGISEGLMNRLQSVQNAAACLRHYTGYRYASVSTSRCSFIGCWLAFRHWRLLSCYRCSWATNTFHSKLNMRCDADIQHLRR